MFCKLDKESTNFGITLPRIPKTSASNNIGADNTSIAENAIKDGIIEDSYLIDSIPDMLTFEN